MKKTSFSFRAIRSRNYLHHFFLGKKNNVARRKTRTRTVMAAAVLVASLGVGALADAQCNTFQNADAANPLLSILPAGKKVAGFAFADIDGDGDQDVYMSYENGTNPPKTDTLHLFRNIGTKEHPIFKEDKETGFGGQLAAPQNEYMQFADIDGDGDLDYFASEDPQYYNNAASIVFYRNDGTTKVPNFVAASANFFPSNVRSYIFQPFALADIDGDGDYDLYVCDISYFNLNSYSQRIYFNKGTNTNPVFDTYVSSSVADGTSRTYYDWNKDGLIDFFTVASFYTSKGFYKNIGPKEAPQFINATKEGPTFKLGGPYRMIDLNNDGAPEVFDFNAHYSTLAPVAVIKDTVVDKSGKRLTVLSSKTQNDNYTYRWEYNGKTIPGAEKYFIATTQPGTYTLYVTDVCGTGVSLNYELLKTTPPFSVADSKMTGVANDMSRIDVKAYPNPFVSAFTVQLPGKSCTIKITDMAGKVLLVQTTSGSKLQVGGNLKAGSYIVQVWQEKEMIYHSTVVKQ